MNKLPASTVKLITCSQVIKNIWNVVKEIVENSFDAGCDCIDVKLVSVFTFWQQLTEILIPHSLECKYLKSIFNVLHFY